MHRSPGLFAVLAIAVSVTACGSSAPADPPAISSPSAGTSPEPSAIPTAPDGLALTGEIETDGPDGVPYARVTLAENHPALAVDPTVVSEPVSAAGFTLEQLTEMVAFAAEYSVEEGLDSMLLNADRVDEWGQDVAPLWFTPENVPAVSEALTVREEGRRLGGLVDNDVIGNRELEGYSLDHPVGGPRISGFHMSLEEVLMSPGGDPAVSFVGFLSRPTASLDDPSEKDIELLCFRQQYALRQVDGAWLLSGWNNQFAYSKPELCEEAGYDDRFGEL